MKQVKKDRSMVWAGVETRHGSVIMSSKRGLQIINRYIRTSRGT